MKVTRSQIREIIREHQAEAEAEYLLNEGFLDFMKKLGKLAMGAFSKAKEASGQFKKALDQEITKSKLDKGALESYAESLDGKTKSMRQSLLKEILASVEKDHHDGKGNKVSKEEAQKVAVAILNYVWSAAGTGE